VSRRRGFRAPRPSPPPPPPRPPRRLHAARRAQARGPSRCAPAAPAHSSGGADGFSYEIARDVVITAALPELVLDFNFVSDAVVIRANRSVTFVGMTIANSR
jgi:hypothetical protein